ncbi:hypothetical protein KFL_007420060 [Klebsormidium nitens]|uniref:ASCH domain-containing protein n=1 Tax=Klebsormidium nitens TaxID=105231 RepID=A0A1Y1IPQ7_KLENI|nr:hypothetical protein KFL_007420060 [Klebsormidium nitens]|eukprot:GAQ91201.1 hypothetical protein KFL_007420060 [Klebsormidium nitens]
MEELCLTLHQPWASLVVYGIKRIEGRNWPTKHKGRLWIHAASKTPDGVDAVEELYRDIYAAEGVTEVKFPEHYPTSVLLGCVEVVGCLSREDLSQVHSLPDSIKLELMSEYGFLCENAQLLEAPVRMRGWQGIFHLDPSVANRALANLKPSLRPKPVRFADHITLEKLQSAESSRSTSRSRGRFSRPDFEGKENEGARGRIGSDLPSSKSDSQTGGTNWEAVLPPRALAARAALMNSMGRGRTSTRESIGPQSSTGLRGRLRATCQPSGDGNVGVDGSKSSGRGQAREGVQQGRANREERAEGSGRVLPGAAESGTAKRGGSVERFDLDRASGGKSQDGVNLNEDLAKRVMETEGNGEADGLKRFGAQLLADYRPPALDISEWPVLGGAREPAPESLLSPGSNSHKRRGEEPENLLADGSCGATPWLARVRLNKAPKLEDAAVDEKAAGRSEVFVPRQLRQKSAVVSHQLT